jgi:hypothetical protein
MLNRYKYIVDLIQRENAFPAENAVSAVVQSEVENIFLIKPHILRHKETLNGLNQVKGFEQKSKSLNGVNNVNVQTI